MLTGPGDEQKPRCRNCVEKDFDCCYSLQVTFLPKNSITLNDEISDRVEGERNGVAVGYDNIQVG